MTELGRIDPPAFPAEERAHELVPIANEEVLLRQKIVAALRRAIELGTLKAGERLIEKDLCARLAVSRTSLREALRDLEANKVVTKIGSRVLVVTPVSPEDAANLYSIRGAIEALITEQFIDRAEDADVQQLREALNRMRGSSGAACLDARRDFFRLWCEGARNTFAFEILMNLQLRLSVVSSAKLQKPELIAQDVAEKEIILERMAGRDVERALEAVREHARHAAETALSVQDDR